MKTLFLFAAIVVGGFPSKGDSWIQKSDFIGTGRYGSVGFSIGSKGYIGTGSDYQNYKKDFWQYDTTSNAWTQMADFGGSEREEAIAFAIDGKGYLGIGYYNNNLNDFWEYNPSSNVWTQKANFGGGNRNGAVGFSIGSKGYVGTGSSAKLKKDFWEYDPSTDTWTKKGDFAGEGRASAVGFSIGNKGYIGTGIADSANKIVYKSDFWEYNPSTDVWTQKTNFGGSARTSATGFSIGDKGYIGLGYETGCYCYHADIWEYDTTANSWTQKADFAGGARDNAVGFSIGDKGYIGTGDDPANYYNDFWEYTPDEACAIPTNLVTTNLTSTTAQLNWNTVATATKYKVQWKESIAASWNSITVTAPTTNTTLTGLTANTKYKWKVKSVCGAGVHSDFSPIVKFTTLLRLGVEQTEALAVYPNPIITSGTISFSLKQAATVSMGLVDVTGRKLQTVLDATLEAGNHEVKFNRAQLAAGIYFLQIKMNEETTVLKVVIQ